MIEPKYLSEIPIYNVPLGANEIPVVIPIL